MSDGGISFIKTMGWSSQELACDVFAKPDWLTELRAARQELLRELRHAFRHLHWLGQKPKPAEPEFPDDVEAFCKAIAAGQPLYPGWSFDQKRAVHAIQRWNDAVDHAWYYGLGFHDSVVKQARPSNKKARAKLGYTRRVTPKQWGKGYQGCDGEKYVAGVREELVRYPISPAAYTNELWRDACQVFMDFVTEGKLPEGVSMDQNLPRLNHKQAGNLLWFLQEVLGWVDTNEVDVCSDCGSLVLTVRETHHWCSKCGKLRCENCTTAPDYCTCENPCGKHCQCQGDDR